MKFLIVGLGNIGAEYEHTRHNIGFMICDYLAQKHDASFTLDKLASQATIKVKGKTIHLIKPTTYMNLSGKAVNYWLQLHKIPVDNMMIVTDDIAIPFGAIRIKPKGSNGGHNGLGNIQEVLNTDVYPRLRFGVGGDFPKGQQVEYVLGKFSETEKQTLDERIQMATEAILSFCSVGLEKTMNGFNKK
jgi:PTH1 family peptidyl-tRNA hydrolase